MMAGNSSALPAAIPDLYGANSMGGLVYKFLTLENGFKALEQKRLKVSLISELNDIFDCNPIVGPENGEPGYLEKSFTEWVVGTHPQVYGLLCFSETVRSPLLWGHYTSCAAGVALGFDPAQFTLEEPIRINYGPVRPIFRWPADVSMNHERWQELFRACFGAKAEEWKYEEEVRYVRELSKCDPSYGLYFAPFHPVSLKQVLLGPRCSVHPTYMWHYLAKHYRGMGVTVHTASMHRERYEIRISAPATPAS
jgi:hypothetical protein